MFQIIFDNMQWDVQELSFLQSWNRPALGVASVVRAAVCCGLSLDSGTRSQCEAATHTHTCVLSSAAVSELNVGKKRREGRCFDSSLPSCCQSDGLHSRPGKKKKKACAADCENLWGLGGNGGKEKGKGEEWEKQKDHVQEEIDRASKKTEQVVVVVLRVS